MELPFWYLFVIGVIIALISVNLVGYAIGISGTGNLFMRVFDKEGIYVFILSFYILCIGYTIMKEIASIRKNNE